MLSRMRLLGALAVVAAAVAGAAVMAPASARAEDALKTLTVAVPEHFPPHYSLSKSGKPQGFAIDIMNAVARRAGLKITYRVYPSWQGVTDALSLPEADVIPNMGITKEREGYLDFTAPYETFFISVFTRSGSRVTGYEDLKGARVATARSNAARAFLEAKPGPRVVLFDTAEEVVDALLNNHVDAIALPDPIVQALLDTAQGDRRREVTALATPLGRIERALAMRENLNPETKALLAVTITQLMRTGELDAIYRKWFSPGELPFPPHALLGAGAFFAVLLLAIPWIWSRRGAPLKGGASQLERSLPESHALRVLRKRIAWMVQGLMVIGMATVGGTTWRLYEFHLEDVRHTLEGIIQTEKRVLERYMDDLPETLSAEARERDMLRFVRENLRFSMGNEEHIIGKIEDGNLVFLLRQADWNQFTQVSYPAGPSWHLPLAHAARGETGSGIDTDYRGERVLAAYTPLGGTGLGLVRKIDIDVIWSDFLRTALPVLAGGMMLWGLGVTAFFVIVTPGMRRVFGNEMALRMILDESPLMILLRAADGPVLMANHLFKKTFERAGAPIEGGGYEDFLNEGTARRFREKDERALKHKTPITSTQSLIVNGAARHFHITRFPIAPRGEGPEWLCLILNDVTDLIAAQQSLMDANRTLRTIGACNEILVRAENEPDLMEGICTAIVRHGKYDAVWVGFPETGGGAAPIGVRPMALAAEGESDRAALDHCLTVPREGKPCPALEALRTGLPVAWPDPGLDTAECPWRIPELVSGLQAFLALPLVFGGETLGVLTIYSRNAEAFSAQSRKLLGEMSSDMAYGLAYLRGRAAHGQTLRELRDREEHFRLLMDSAGDGIIAIDAHGRGVDCNPSAAAILRCARGDIVGGDVHALFHAPRHMEPPCTDVSCAILHSLRTLSPSESEDARIVLPDGTMLYGRYSMQPLIREGQATGMVMVFQDLTAAIEAERQQWQAQKLDSLGSLAGGIAHDFNNLLLPIQALTEMTLRDLPEDSRAHGRLVKVLEASRKAKDVVGRILQFGRKEDIRKVDLDIAQAVRDALPLLRTTLPSSMRIVDRLDDGVGRVYFDPSEIHMVLINLGSNAADALGGRTGEMIVELARVTPDALLLREIPKLKPGLDYARLRVKDDGPGMDEQTLRRALDPFFTTKPVGEGTGLGLAIVHSIVTKQDGALRLHSLPGRGTTVEMYLPIIGEL